MMPTTFMYKSYTGEMVTRTFKCEICEHDQCYRHKSMYGLTFLEGHFHCIRCKKEASYATDDWDKSVKQEAKQLQLTLF